MMKAGGQMNGIVMYVVPFIVLTVIFIIYPTHLSLFESCFVCDVIAAILEVCIKIFLVRFRFRLNSYAN